MLPICDLLLKGRAGLSVQKLLRSVVLMAMTGYGAEGPGMRRVGGLLIVLPCSRYSLTLKAGTS